MTTDASFSVDLGGAGVTVEFSDECGGFAGIGDEVSHELCQAVSRTLEGEGVVKGSVDVIAVTSQAITELNRSHMGADGPTDVLSFPLDDPSEGDSFGFCPHVGDIVVCPEIAADQAAGHAGSLEAELHLLVIHAALHLLGHDHAEERERQVMQALEARYLGEFGFGHPGDQQ